MIPLKNSVAFSPQANYTAWATATCRRNLMPSFVDRGVWSAQRINSHLLCSIIPIGRMNRIEDASNYRKTRIIWNTSRPSKRKTIWNVHDFINMNINIYLRYITYHNYWLFKWVPLVCCKTTPETNSVAFSPQANYTDWSTATCWQNLVPTFADRGVSRDQRGGSPTAINLSFLDRSRYFSFK
jgi:hypothetical protein